MRRPLLLFLYAQAAVILILYYLNPWDTKRFLDKNSELLLRTGNVAQVDGVAVSVQIKPYYTSLVIDTGKEKTLLRISGLEDESAAYDLVGRHIVAQGRISQPDARRNRGCFDYRLYLKGHGIYTITELSKYRLKAGRIVRPVEHFLSHYKGLFYESIRPIMTEEDFSVLSGLLFGDKSYMNDELYEQYQNNGIAHVLAVSGLHVGLMYNLIVKLSGGKKSLISTLISCLILYSYAALSSFSISVLRASCMILLKLIAFHIDRRYDMICAASITAIVFLFINPYQLFDSGFQLSFTAAYSLGTALPYMESKFLKFANKHASEKLSKLGSFMLPCLAVQLGMTPLTVFHFLHISPIGIFLNPVAIALAGLILPAGLVLFIVSAAGIGVLTAAASGPARLFIKLLSLAGIAGENIGLSGPCTAPPLHLLILYYILFFYFFSETRIKLNRQRREKPLAVIACILMLFIIFIPKGYENPPVTFVDVGQGDCIHIHHKGFNILIDGGGSRYKNVGKDILRSYLLKNGVSSIDLAIVTHQDQDHAKGISELSECFNVKRIMAEGTDNDDCTICSVSINGINFLFMADAGKASEEALMSAYPYLKCNVLKAGHHGSAGSSSEEFLNTLNPDVIVISCGKNNSYGHPSSEFIDRLKRLQIPNLRTDQMGAISFMEYNGNNLIFENAQGDEFQFSELDNCPLSYYNGIR